MEGNVLVRLDQVRFDTQISFDTVGSGYLQPQLEKFEISIANSNVHVDNQYFGWVITQVINISKLMIEAGVNFLGKEIFNRQITAICANYANNYRYPLELDFKRLNKQANFTIDYRFTQPPKINEKSMDIEVIGEIMY